MKIFLTGATGFVGSFLAELMLKNNYEVRCLVRKRSNLRWIADLNIECFYGSLEDKNSLKKGLEGCEYVYHVAGLTKGRTETDFFIANFEGTKNLVDACLESDVKFKRFIYVSTQAAVGPSPTLIPIDESQKPNPLTWYGKSKLAGEEYILKNSDKLPVTIVRAPAVYGPRDTDVLNFFKTVKVGLIPRLGGKERYLSLIHVRDLIRGILISGESKKARGGIYFITSDRPYAWSEISQVTLKYFNKKGIRVSVPESLMQSIAFVSETWAALTKKSTIVNMQKVIEMKQDFWTCSPDKAKKELGFSCEISLEDGVNETLAWYQQHKWI